MCVLVFVVGGVLLGFLHGGFGLAEAGVDLGVGEGFAAGADADLGAV